jgi:hypothetical protein
VSCATLLKSTTPDRIKTAIGALLGARIDFRPTIACRGLRCIPVPLAAETAAEVLVVIEIRVDVKSEVWDLDTHIDAHRKCITLAVPLDPP